MLSIVAVLMFGNVAAFLLAAWLLSWRPKWGFYVALAVLLVNIVLTFTDQFGLFELLTLLLDLTILALLLAGRRQFLQPMPSMDAA